MKIYLSLIVSTAFLLACEPASEPVGQAESKQSEKESNINMLSL